MKSSSLLRAFSVIAASALCAWHGAVWAGEASEAEAKELIDALSAYPNDIVFETFREGNWELFRMRPDGSDPVNLTNTPDVDELYPHVSPDGTRISFVVDRGEGEAMIRSVYYMNLDGTGRTFVADYAREPCWGPDSKTIAYLADEANPLEVQDGKVVPVGNENYRFTYMDYATKGIYFYDLGTKTHRQHPNKEILHLYNLCWSPKGDWLIATVHGGMGYDHANLAIEANGMRVFNVYIGGCRPDFSPDGTKIAWGRTDYSLCVADVDLTGPKRKISNEHAVANSPEPMAIYHIDWSPDGKYVAFSTGPHHKRLGLAPEIIGVRAPDWRLGVCRADGEDNPFVIITETGSSTKEPDWAPVPATKP